MKLSGSTAIAGIGATEFSTNSGRSELQLAAEATLAALADAGIPPSEVDGLTTLTFDTTAELDLFRTIGGRDLKFNSRINYGGAGACAPFLQAAIAVATGVASTVVCYRSMNERSGLRFGRADPVPFPFTSGSAQRDLSFAHGLRTPAAACAIAMRRYMHEYGATCEDFGAIAVASRHYASTNPKARFFNKPITLDEYLNSRMIADPLRLYDCCLESDGGVAFVVTATERARDLAGKPVAILGVAQGACDQQMMLFDLYRRDLTRASEARLCAEQVYKQSGLTPDDVDVAMIYDHFGPTVMLQLEAYGFCGRGEATEFVRSGEMNIGGRLPINTHGGMVGEAYIHGMNGVAEAVRQLRGTAVNQVKDAKVALATAGVMGPTSAMVLGAI
jgi:acetyl-CoA acetyltransferase